MTHGEVADDRVRPIPVAEQLWGARCLAYSVNIRLPGDATAEFVRVQDRFASLDGLLRVPEGALHISAVNLLDVRAHYRQGKAKLWERFGARWIAAVAKAAAASEPFVVSYHELRATSAAVVAVAHPVAAIDILRRTAEERLSLPAETPRQRTLIHTTLFRYASSEVDLREVQMTAGAVRLGVSFVVDELAVMREERFPSLEVQTLAVIPVGDGTDATPPNCQPDIW